MNVDIKMPDLATTDSDVTIVRWLVEVGQMAQRGQPLIEIDKATMEVEAVAVAYYITNEGWMGRQHESPHHALRRDTTQ